MKRLALLLVAPLSLGSSSGTITDAYKDAGRRLNIDWQTLYQIGAVESSHRPGVVARKCSERDRKNNNCASGLMQTKYTTALEVCPKIKRADLFDPYISAYCGGKYYAKQLKLSGSKPIALGRYTEGPTGYERAKLQNTEHRRKRWKVVTSYVAKVESVTPPPQQTWWIYGL